MTRLSIYCFCLFIVYSNNVYTNEISNNFVKESIDIIPDQDLREVIKKYYDSEMNEEWNDTYKIRSLDYRDAINFNDYSREMSKGAAGWKLIKISILEFNYSNNNYEILIKFDELIDENVKSRKLINSYIQNDELFKEVEFDSKTNTFSYTEKTLWRHEQNRWVAINPGPRQHLYMNSKIISE